MKVVFIIPTLGSGGAERVFSSLLNDWSRNKKCDVELILLMKSNDFYQIDKNIKVHRIDFESNNSFKLLYFFKILYLLRRKIIEIEPDACFSFIRESNILTLLAVKGLNVTTVISERDSPNTKISKLYNFLREKLYPLCDGLIVQTEDYRKFVFDNISSKINQVVIPNPVRNIPSKFEARENIILNIGRLIPVKGQKYLLEAFSKCKYRDGWKLVVLGDGVLKDTLVAYAKELKIEDQVYFLGATKNVDDWLKKSSIFAFTSLSEGFPNALAEAMSAALPCVSFDCVTGPKDLIDNGKTGYLIDILDTDSFSQKLDNLIESSQLRADLGNNAKKLANSLDFNTISERYFRFIKDTIEKDF